MSSDFRDWIAAWVAPRDTSGPRPEDLRASHADRERVIAALTDAAADGRLTAVEHEERVEAAYRAQTLGQLAQLTLDLLPPESQPFVMHDKPVMALFRTENRGGRWVVPSKIPVTSFGGNVNIDLRDALLQSNRVVVQLAVMAGTVTLLVPDGVLVTPAPGARVRSFKNQTRPPESPTPPVIELAGFVYGGKVIARCPKPPKRGLFRRQP
ncbi:hypothetical protein Aph01nite_72270 [Acrocarpospora phusangensis]|uniref:DUF1707 domain-containing protein n=1 Tax=Acrocarpospora phusangensis TaxID=1070424 RepID=A0A919QML3_9ACTN|nr:DUF1707 domain-containing protein [Acrocarpospora phusangensis]GIH28917.1 hypothetical protein Aph01nite_72270 [Acrocarpospora phusangensis]